jgi:hypothetical protein
LASISFTDDNNGTAVGWVGTILRTTNGGVTFIEDNERETPGNFTLMQNYPNPFNPTTTIKYQIPELSFITLKIYDVLGNEITTLVDEEKSAGNYGVNFSASSLTSGIYCYQIKAGEFTETRKMLMLK